VSSPGNEPGGGLLAGKVVVCTGAGSGIGRAVVSAMLAEGARVAALEVAPEKCAGLRQMGEGITVLEGDATTVGANQELVDAATDRWGRLDVAVTFVGLFDLYTALVDIPSQRLEAAYRELFDRNVLSPLMTARAALPALREQRGSIIFTLSSSSFAPGRGGALYVASKFALRGALIQLAHDAAPDVRVNGVAPGGTIGTDLRGPSALGLAERRLDDRPGRADELRQRTPLQMALEPADHAGCYLFLASDRARHLTGEIIRSDGGLGVR
jgi:2,3-dihydroxy-2,3-dihydrophenylpropionate dehydrogenase